MVGVLGVLVICGGVCAYEKKLDMPCCWTAERRSGRYERRVVVVCCCGLNRGGGKGGTCLQSQLSSNFSHSNNYLLVHR